MRGRSCRPWLTVKMDAENGKIAAKAAPCSRPKQTDKTTPERQSQRRKERPTELRAIAEAAMTRENVVRERLVDIKVMAEGSIFVSGFVW